MNFKIETDKNIKDLVIGQLIKREPFDYTKWRTELESDLTIQQISEKAMVYSQNKKA